MKKLLAYLALSIATVGLMVSQAIPVLASGRVPLEQQPVVIGFTNQNGFGNEFEIRVTDTSGNFYVQRYNILNAGWRPGWDLGTYFTPVAQTRINDFEQS